jgi:quinol monooxygenase YgiN
VHPTADIYHLRVATILAHIRVKDGREAEFESVARRLFEATHRDETRVLRYEYWRGAAPRTYYTLLAFEDFRAFLAHQTSGHHEAATPALRDVVESIRLEWVDPVQGASELPPTRAQDVPANADALTREYAVRYSADVAPWWEALR